MSEPQKLPPEVVQSANDLGEKFRASALGSDPVAVVIAAATVMVHAARECGIPAAEIHPIIDQMYTVKREGSS